LARNAQDRNSLTVRYRNLVVEFCRLAEAEREILTQAIMLAEGNQAKVVRCLGLSQFTLREKLKHAHFCDVGSV